MFKLLNRYFYFFILKNFFNALMISRLLKIDLTMSNDICIMEEVLHLMKDEKL